ncbi:Succinate semialdehyde dehydrogenase [NAD(P)+] Sad [Chromobacterium violaceum]|uniref:Succinate semialdehyde dehydrogenase [NAD(P)+] Sad n=1 Tax=Chromobacterium violaceum TaxID=536 RepID=A0A3S4IBM6_CHRVL|nr:Succinate semialdehyde dehydrogenase [NAD(P)+] Sad [Chromobacterium violaceum]
MTAFTSCNPSSGEVCFTRPSWNPSALEVSLRQLRDAQGAWADLNVEQRAKRLLRLADLLSQQREALADLVTLEVGKRTSECLAEIDKSAQLIRYYAELAPELLQPLRIATQASRSGVAFEPLGLVLAVMPWNYPVWQVLRFAIPALMSGNACLVKPAPSVPQCSQLLLDIVRQAGLRVLDIAWIETELVEEAIRQCDAVAFTGSTQTGRAIASLAGRHLKKTVLELGGSNPFIVLADADIEAAARDAANSRFRDAGQSCNAAKRMIVVPEIADAFVEAFCGEASKLRAGDPATRPPPCRR